MTAFLEMKSALQHENDNTRNNENIGNGEENGEQQGINVSTDTCRQKKGSGKAYNSLSAGIQLEQESNATESTIQKQSQTLSGCASFIGINTGKVVGIGLKSKSCRFCEVAQRKGRPSKPHKCTMNHTGSAKGMEPELVVELVKDVMRKGKKIEEISGDDDTTGFVRAQRELNTTMKKRSDQNHIIKNISKDFIALKQKHKGFSQKVINYIMKNFSYMLAQNKGKPENIENGLKYIVCHIYGDHNHCSNTWCVFKQDKPDAKFRHLPYGKPLSNPLLREDLEKIFVKKLSKHTEKLAYLSSTQANENLNNILATKAPKYKHYCSSLSLGFRYSAAVSQKNEGHRYVHEVHNSMGLSPGNNTIKRAGLLDRLKERYRKLHKSVKGKTRRLVLKAERGNYNTTAEILEGTTYESNVDMEEEKEDGMIEIPRWDDLKYDDSPIIIFDLETTGLARTSDILQIAAVSKSDVFSTYIVPSKKITKQASEITKLKFFDGQMYYKDSPVISCLPYDGCFKFYFFSE